MILHKYPTTAMQYSHVHPQLRKIIDVMAYLVFRIYGEDLTITAIHDPAHPGGTHRLLERFHRFVDIRVLSTRERSEWLRKTVNFAFPYAPGDPSRGHLMTIPDLDHESTLGGPSTAAHFHVQIAPAWLQGGGGFPG